MILIKFFKKQIPSFRHKKVANIFDNTFFFIRKSKTHKNLNLIKRSKRIYSVKSTDIQHNTFNYTNVITKTPHYSFKPYKKYMISQSLDNFTSVLPGIEFLNVGKVIYHYKFFKDYRNKFFFKGFATYLYTIPLTVFFCNVSNSINNKITYAKSCGTYCKTKKTKKTKRKLISVILPSGLEIFLNKHSKAYVGKNENLKINELVEGKWGFSFYKKKSIAVRGVAMNPVDHPNGGRTKTVKPEKSPWNWVAKCRK